jgi:hypothetical protein
MITQTNYNSGFPTAIWSRHKMNPREPNWLIYLCSSKACGEGKSFTKQCHQQGNLFSNNSDWAIFQFQLQVTYFYFASS